MPQALERGRIRVNGRDVSLIVATVADLLAQQAVDWSRHGIAIALNGSVVPRSVWRETVLKPGDSVEIVRAMQGG